VVRGESQEKNAVSITFDLYRVARRAIRARKKMRPPPILIAPRSRILVETRPARARPAMMLFLPILMAVRGSGADDTGLVTRMQRRDPQALAELYDRYGRVVYALILRVVRDTGIAEDLVQETFLRVWNRVGGFDAQKGSIGPWLLAVARNRSIDYLRSAGGRERNAVEFEE